MYGFPIMVGPPTACLWKILLKMDGFFGDFNHFRTP